jgi:hypothetical protein
MEDRGNSLEEEFFRKQNAELTEKLRATRAREESRRLMSETSGITDESVLDHLIDEGMTPASLAALSLAPLVAVAWADRKLEDKERKAVIEGAGQQGIAPGSPEHDLLEEWLNQAPPASLMETWTSYATALAGSLEPTDLEALRTRLVDRATAVANAAGGGFAGMGSKMSDGERAVLDRVRSALGG